MSTNEAIIRNLSLALKNTAAIATKQRSVDSLTKVVTDHGIALDYVSQTRSWLSHGRHPLLCPRLRLLGKLTFGYRKSLNKLPGFNGDSFEGIFL